MYRVLSVSYDPVLLKTRAMILRGQGYAVSSAQNLRDAVRLSQETPFDVAIIGHSIPFDDQSQIAAAIRKNCPAIRIVALMRHQSEKVSFADRAVEAHKPEEIIAELRRILGGEKPTRRVVTL